MIILNITYLSIRIWDTIPDRKSERGVHPKKKIP